MILVESITLIQVNYFMAVLRIVTHFCVGGVSKRQRKITNVGEVMKDFLSGDMPLSILNCTNVFSVKP